MSNQGFGGDDDDNKSDIERLLDGISSAKQWYEQNSDLFDRFMEGGSSVDLDGDDPLSEAHVNEERVLIVADVSGAGSTDLELSFYENKVSGKLGDREFTVDVPSDVDEDTIEADMKNGVLRVELERDNEPGDDLTVDTADRTDEEADEGVKDSDDLTDIFDEETELEDDDEGGEE